MKFSPIPRITLPSIKPQANGARFKYDYDQDLWELDHARLKYLVSLTDADLFSRHSAIVKNMLSLTSPDRHLIPIESFHSSWYWYRKEHQTRYEISRRNLPLPLETVGLPLIAPTNHFASIRPSFPNSGNILYRYSNIEFAKTLLRTGNLYLKCASEMALHENDDARFDNETSKTRFTAQSHIKITKERKQIHLIGDLKYTSSFPDYYLFCLSTDFDPILLKEFGGACVAIKNPEEFSNRLQKWGEQNLPGWIFGDLPVEYFDPYEPIQNHITNATITKNFYFSYQREFRYLFSEPTGHSANPIPPIEIGCIEDIAEIIAP